MEEIERPPTVDISQLRFVNLVPLQKIAMDDPNLGLYTWESYSKETLFLQNLGANPKTLIERNIIYVFLRTNIIFDLEVVYNNKYNVECVKVPMNIQSLYLFNGLPAFNAIRGIKINMPKMNTHSLSQEHTNLNLSKRIWLTLYGTPPPTSTVRVGRRARLIDGHLARIWGIKESKNLKK